MSRVRNATIYFLAAAALALLIGLLVPADRAVARDGETASSRELINWSDRYDGKRVVYRGEIVGDILDRGEYSWITVNDDDYGGRHLHRFEELRGTNTGMGVYCRSEFIEDVTYVGSYRAAGDLIEVRGTFYRANPRHGGDLMIEADQVRILRKGHTITRHPFGCTPLIAAILAPICLALGAIWITQRRHFEKSF